MNTNLESHFDLSNPTDAKLLCFIRAFNKTCSDSIMEAGRTNKSIQETMNNNNFELNLLRNTKTEMTKFIEKRKGNK